MRSWRSALKTPSRHYSQVSDFWIKRPNRPKMMEPRLTVRQQVAASGSLINAGSRQLIGSIG
jgi:hypothetical protein